MASYYVRKRSVKTKSVETIAISGNKKKEHLLRVLSLCVLTLPGYNIPIAIPGYKSLPTFILVWFLLVKSSISSPFAEPCRMFVIGFLDL